MQISESSFTRHAKERSTARRIPLGVAQMILGYGRPSAARDGARRFALDKRGLRELRRDYGREIAKTLEPYRAAYVIESDGQVVTAAFAPRRTH